MKMNEMIIPIKYIRVFSLLILALMIAACGSKEDKLQKHLEKARAYAESNEYKKAVIELKNVIQLEPKNDTAHYELGEAYLKLKDGREAFQSFSRAVSINPDNIPAQLKMGQILLLGRKTKEAKEKAGLVLSKLPDDIEALSLMAGIYIQEKDLDSALSTLIKVSELKPDHLNTQVSLGRVYLMKNDLENAEKMFQRVIKLDPKDQASYIELSRIYGSRGEWEKAEKELLSMVEGVESKYQGINVLANFYESRNRLDDAEKQYLKAVELAPVEDIAPLINLGAFYARRKSYEKALDAMQKASAIKKDDTNVMMNIAALHFDFAKLDDAEATVDSILAKDKGHIGANFLKARLYLAKKDFNNGLERLELVLRDQPENSAALYLKGLCLINKGELELAKGSLLKAVEVNPRLVEARLILAEFYLRSRDKELARKQIDSVLEILPENIQALTLLGNLRVLENDAKGAEEAYIKVTELNKDDAGAYMRLGVLYNMTNRAEDAKGMLQKALEIDPNRVDALGILVGLLAKEKKYDNAIELCNTYSAKAGDKKPLIAIIEYLRGNLFLEQEKIDEARGYFEKAIETDPNLLPPYEILATISLKDKNHMDAIKRYEEIIAKRPDYFAGYMKIGTIYDQLGDNKKAEEFYRKALSIKKDFGAAANNLAWKLAEKGENIDEALDYARIAKEQMPDNPSVMDTLGWIYYLKGSYLNAISELQDSVEKASDNPVINYHLGMALVKNNKPAEAGVYLKKALTLDPGFKGADEAKKVLQDIEAGVNQ
jgi:tetratricopeptide (TPR) repeat protein